MSRTYCRIIRFCVIGIGLELLFCIVSISDSAGPTTDFVFCANLHRTVHNCVLYCAFLYCHRAAAYVMALSCSLLRFRPPPPGVGVKTVLPPHVKERTVPTPTHAQQEALRKRIRGHATPRRTGRARIYSGAQELPSSSEDACASCIIINQ